MPRVAAARRHDLTDAQWAGLQPVLPTQSCRGRPPRWTKRQIIDGIRWRVRTGIPWRDVPEVYAPLADLVPLVPVLAAGRHLGEGPGRVQASADAGGKIDWTVSVDSNQPRPPARRRRPPRRPPAEGTTRWCCHRARRSWAEPIERRVHHQDAPGLRAGRKTLAVVITGGQRGDSPQFITFLERIKVYRIGGGRPRTRPDLVLADKAYAKPRRPRVRPPPKAAGLDPEQGRRAQGQRIQRRTAARVQPDRLPAAARRGMRHQPTQAAPRHGHPLRL